MLRAIIILLKSNIKLELKSKVAFLTNLVVPITYPIIFTIIAIMTFNVNPHAFKGLTVHTFLIALFAHQTIFWLSFDRSMRMLVNDILDSSYDVIIMKPLSMFFYKYFRRIDVYALAMVILDYTVFIILAFTAHLSLIILIKMTVLIIFASLIYLNLKCCIYGLVFYYRDAKQLAKLHQALEDLTHSKPPDIFPSTFRFVLTYIIPYIVIQGFVFSLMQGNDSLQFWTTVLIWTVILIVCNHTLWAKGLKRYESTG